MENSNSGYRLSANRSWLGDDNNSDGKIGVVNDTPLELHQQQPVADHIHLFWSGDSMDNHNGIVPQKRR